MIIILINECYITLLPKIHDMNVIVVISELGNEVIQVKSIEFFPENNKHLCEISNLSLSMITEWKLVIYFFKFITLPSD